MDLQRIAAKSLIGLAKFPNGIAFDFGTLPEGVIGVVGPNGHGKTTFLEAPITALYKTFPSRPGNSLIDSCDATDAFLEAVVFVEGRGKYRARVNVDAVRRATDAQLELTGLDGVTRPLNDGKIKTFEEAVARELPALDVLLASAFAAQNKQGAFSELGKVDRKKLFAQFLGFDQYERFAATAIAAAAIADKRLTALRSVLERLQADTTPAHEDEISATGNALQADLLAAEHARNEATADLVVRESAIEDIRTRAAAYTAAESELAIIRHRQTDRTREREQLARDREALDRDETRDLQAIRASGARTVGLHEGILAGLETPQALARSRDAALADIETRLQAGIEKWDLVITNNRTHLIARDAEIRAAHAAAAVCEQTITDAMVLEQDARTALVAAERAQAAARADVAGAGNPQAALDRAHGDAALIDRVPFGADCVKAKCEFVMQAAAARADIPTLMDAVAALAQLREVETRATDAVDVPRAELQRLGTVLRETRARIAALKPTADYLPQLNDATGRIRECEGFQAALRDQATLDRAAAVAAHDAAVLRVGHARTAALTAIEAATAETATHLQETSDAWAEKRGALSARVRALDEAIASLKQHAGQLTATVDTHAAAHAELVQAEQAIAAGHTALAYADRQMAIVEEQVKAFEGRRERFMRLVVDRDRHASAVHQLEDERQEWTLLAKILGRDGLQVLEIANAGPGVSDLANDLLQACYGGRFQIELVTQEPKADGKGFKEVFDVKVTDSEKGTEPDLADLSGGERVIVDEALRSAIALYNNARNILPIRTCWRDETVGALDPDAAMKYVAMLRRVQQRGGFTRLFFISHNLDAAALADAQIAIHDGQIDVRYPPYASEAA